MTPASSAGGRAPRFVFERVVKTFGADAPLRVASLVFQPGHRVVLAGCDAALAEMFTHLLTGASLPDEGVVSVDGRSTRDIATDTEWLASLDRFGLVSNRAVLLDQSTVAQNLALPLTLSIDPVPEPILAQVRALAADVELSPAVFDAPVGALTAEQRMRVHLARAVALRPQVLLLEHPTSSIAAHGAAFGALVKRVADARGLDWFALSNDDAFARASGGRVLTLRPDGQVRPSGAWWSRWFQPRRS